MPRVKSPHSSSDRAPVLVLSTMRAIRRLTMLGRPAVEGCPQLAGVPKQYFEVPRYDPPVSGNNGFEFDAIAQSCDSAVDAGARAALQTTQRNLAGQKTRTRWRMAAVNVFSVL